MRRIDFFAFKMYSYDTESLADSILHSYKDALILVFDFEKIIIWHKPADISMAPHFNLKNSLLSRWIAKNKIMGFCLSPFQFFNALFVTYFQLLRIFLRYRPKICWIENTYAAFFVGILKQFRLCSSMVYLSGDWTAGSKNKNLWSYLANNWLFPIIDYVACRSSDIVLNHTREIGEARHRFWKRSVAAKEGLYNYKPKIKALTTGPSHETKKSICFLGNLRRDSGLDVAIDALAELRQKYDFSLKIIGPRKEAYEYFKRLAADRGLEDNVHFFGFMETDRLPRVLSDCFCGLNILTHENSYSSYTIPGKIIHYFQFLLPVIGTKGIGPIANTIINRRLGFIIEPTSHAFTDAAIACYREETQLRNNITDYIQSLEDVDIPSLIEGRIK